MKSPFLHWYSSEKECNLHLIASIIEEIGIDEFLTAEITVNDKNGKNTYYKFTGIFCKDVRNKGGIK